MRKLIPSIILSLFLLIFSASSAWCGVTVEKIEPDRLDALMTGKETGRYVLVALAAWCAPCKKELPGLVRLYAAYEKRGLKIFGISLDFEGPEAMQPIVEKFEVNFPVYWAGEAAIEKYGISKIPMIILIKDGKVWEKIFGYRGEADLKKIFDEFLK